VTVFCRGLAGGWVVGLEPGSTHPWLRCCSSDSRWPVGLQGWQGRAGQEWQQLPGLTLTPLREADRLTEMVGELVRPAE